MENLTNIGKVYNELCDKIESEKARKANLREKDEIAKSKEQLALLKGQLIEFCESLSKEEKDVFFEYRKIRRDIKKCAQLKLFDRSEKKFFKKFNPAYVYMIPAAIGAVFFTLLPFVFMIIGSLFKLDLVNITKSQFVDIWNYQMIFLRDKEFVGALGNTIVFAIITIVLLMVVTTLMAAWLSKNTKIHNFSQTLIFTPHISSMVSVAILWVLMLDPMGIINQILAIFGIKGPNWLMDTRTSLLSVALVTVWKSIGYYCLIIIAGLQALPKDVYEAAKLDKASKFTVFRKVTLPMLMPTLSFVFVMKFISSFQAFAAIDIMTQGGPQGSSMVLGYWIYNAGRVKFNYGFSMAGAVIMTIMVAGFTIIANKVGNRKSKEQ